MQNFPSLLSNADASAEKACKYREVQGFVAMAGKNIPRGTGLAR